MEDFLKIYPPRYRKKNTLSILKEELPNQNKRPFGVIFRETIGKPKLSFIPMFSSRRFNSYRLYLSG